MNFFFSFLLLLPQISLPQVVWTNKRTVSRHLNTSCQLPFLLPPGLHPLCASGLSSRFYQQDICASFSNLPFSCISLLPLPFLSSSAISSQVCRHRIRARICIGFRDSPPPLPPPPSAVAFPSCSALSLCCCYGMTWQGRWRLVVCLQLGVTVDCAAAALPCWAERGQHGYKASAASNVDSRTNGILGCDGCGQNFLCFCNRQGWHS